MIRDALIGFTPASALQNPWYIGTALVGSLVAFALPLEGRAWELFRFHGDMVIVGVWAVTGTVTAVNEEIEDNYEAINNDPFGEGWLFEVEVDEAGELMDAAAYASANGLD